MAEKGKTPAFAVGQAAKREVKRALVRSTNPAETISNFQQTRSLHSMFARAFGTTPQYAAETDEQEQDEGKSSEEVESLDTDSVLAFLTRLGVSQFDVHKRISDSLQKQLEDEIRKTSSQAPLLNLLQSCWKQATTVPEFRPILWAVLKQLGDKTPLVVLKALAEREENGTLKHTDIFRPLPPLLKRLVWEADWDDKVPMEKEQTISNPKDYLKLVQSTLLYETVDPLVEKYCATEALLESSSKFFVTSALERRVLTTQRRALTHSSTTTTTTSTSSTTALLGKSSSAGGTAASTSTSSEPLLSSGKAVSQVRQLLGDTAGGTASYRPKLLHAILSMLMGRHGGQAPKLLTGTHLHCTLVADILLSAGGPLPKIYSHVHTLARVLDDAVKNGVFSNSDLMKVQATLKNIYEAEQAAEDVKQTDEGGDGKTTKITKKKSAGGVSDANDDLEEEAKPKKTTTFLKRQLNRIITAGLSAMKESDPQNLFLNPVTDSIAPGYSKVIKKPMCISTMEEKIDDSEYNSIDEWTSDVRLMFKNCADYNRGQAGQWFRGEANRQLKVFKDEILSQAKKLYQAELQKRNPDDETIKRAREVVDKTPQISPLPPTNKRRKTDTQEFTLSMPALASMLLADPFVVRLLLDRVLRSLRIDVLRGTSIPVAHSVVPSILQLLHMAQWSTHICALRGRRYLVPDPGLAAPESMKSLETIIPYDSLRRYLPVLMHLMLEAELNKRLVVGGDLNTVADSITRPSAPSVSLEEGSPPLQVAVALLEGAFVYVCLPGNSQEASLSVTFKKFANTLLELNGSIWDEGAFFKCLVPAILRHKARLNRTVRDTIIETWMDWLRASDNRTSSKKKKAGSMVSAAHEYIVLLLNEWASFGNLLMPRDMLLKVSSELVEAVNGTETAPEGQFAELWKQGEAKEFESIKKQYERMLSLLPESHSTQWKVTVGIEKKELEETKETFDEDVDQDMASEANAEEAEKMEED